MSNFIRNLVQRSVGTMPVVALQPSLPSALALDLARLNELNGEQVDAASTEPSSEVSVSASAPLIQRRLSSPPAAPAPSLPATTTPHPQTPSSSLSTSDSNRSAQPIQPTEVGIPPGLPAAGAMPLLQVEEDSMPRSHQIPVLPAPAEQSPINFAAGLGTAFTNAVPLSDSTAAVPPVPLVTSPEATVSQPLIPLSASSQKSSGRLDALSQLNYPVSQQTAIEPFSPSSTDTVAQSAASLAAAISPVALAKVQPVAPEAIAPSPSLSKPATPEQSSPFPSSANPVGVPSLPQVIEVRIGTIEIQATPLPPPATPPSEPMPQGFDEYLLVRTYVNWERD